MTGPAKVVLPYRDWRLGNALWLSAHFYASALEHGFLIEDAGFDPYGTFFPRSGTPFLPVDPQRAARWQRWKRILPRVPSGRIGPWVHRNSWRPAFLALQRQQNTARGLRHLPLDGEPWRNTLRSARVVVATGYYFRANELVLRHAKEVRAGLGPSLAVLAAADQVTEGWGGRRVLGVHQRLGDYRTYQDGRFAFSPDTYSRWVRQVTEREPAVNWLIAVFSDENEPLPLVPGREVRRMSGDAATDLVCMARCDAILGPPSSFSLWAAWWGEVPLAQVDQADAPLPLDAFTRVDTLRMP